VLEHRRQFRLDGLLDDLPSALLDQIVQALRPFEFSVCCLTAARFLRTFRHGGGFQLWVAFDKQYSPSTATAFSALRRPPSVHQIRR